MGQALVRSLVVQAYLAAIADDRRDLRCTEFRGFLNGPVHSLAARQALAQVDFQRRLRLAVKPFVELDLHLLLADRAEPAAILETAAVEQLDRITDPQTQYARNVMGLGIRQLVPAKSQGEIDEKAG